ncbi:MAG: protein kinase, partial [Acidobacteriota bacterium]
AKVTASLDHPGVVAVYTMGRDSDGRHYYTMKPLRGRSLEQILTRRRKGDPEFTQQFALRRLLEIIQRVAETIAYAHGQQVIHLDLTPRNIVVGELGEVTVIDWATGSSWLHHKSPKTGPGGLQLFAGSPDYLSPEQLPDGSGAPGPPSDVFSLGAILYEVLTGQTPYRRGGIREGVEALRRSELVPPEQLAPHAGIDPLLSDLCMEALCLERERRPTARGFAERLGRYVRRERDWEVVRFGPDDHALIETEWSTVVGRWALDGDEWVPLAENENILFWNVRVPGSFRLICEGWSERSTELSIIGRGPALETLGGANSDRLKHNGYCFQLGAEDNTCSKLARNENDVMADAGILVEPGRRYRLELAYEDGWVRCLIDGRLIFHYRELFPFPGQHVGLYAWNPGSRLRPIELHKENWGLEVPVIRMADDLLRNGLHEIALQYYREIAAAYEHRLEGHEAKMKAGICLERLGRIEEARAIFRSLAGSQMESFALAEEAMLDFRSAPEVRPERGIEAFRQLSERFPLSQARTRILDAAVMARGEADVPVSRPSAEEELRLRLEIQLLGRETLARPVMSQIRCQITATLAMFQLGKWPEALESLLAYTGRLLEQQQDAHGLPAILHMAALANDREDLIPKFPRMDWYYLVDFMRSLVPELFASWLVRAPEPNELLDKFVQYWNCHEHDRLLPELEGAVGLLALGHANAACERFEQDVVPRINVADHRYLYGVSNAVLSSGQEPMFRVWTQRLERAARDQVDADAGQVLVLNRVRWALEGGALDRAAEAFCAWTPGQDLLQPMWHSYDWRGDIVVLATLFHSLGLWKGAPRQVGEETCRRQLTGTRLDLARMFLGLQEPQPGALWPAPQWHPEWRLWLALWLEARGDRTSARAVAEPAVDRRMRGTFCQPALLKLLARLDA